MRVLITNLNLEGWTGTELFVRDVARALLAKGHSPIVYSPRLGRLAAEIRDETIPVVDDLSQVATPPDVIHGQHVNETITALLHFHNVPAIYVCHDWYFKDDHPPRFPRILRYVAVDDQCYDKLIYECGVPEDKTQIICQFVDLDKFQARSPLPARPRRAAILCNHTKENEHLKAVRHACSKRGVTLDVFGAGVGRTCERPETVLRDYDIVFAKARAALESAAVGAAVVVYWWRRLGPMVMTGNLEQLRRDGFGMRAMSEQLAAEECGRALDKALEEYDPADATEVSRRVRAEAGSDLAIDQLLRIYEEVIAENAATPHDREKEAHAAAAHIRNLTLDFRRQRESIFNSTTFRVGERLRKTPGIGKLTRSLARGIVGRREG